MSHMNQRKSNVLKPRVPFYTNEKNPDLELFKKAREIHVQRRRLQTFDDLDIESLSDYE